MVMMKTKSVLSTVFLTICIATSCSSPNGGSTESSKGTYNRTPATLQNATPGINAAAVTWTVDMNALLSSGNLSPSNDEYTNIMRVSALREAIDEAAQNALSNKLRGIREYGAPFLFEYAEALDQVLNGLIYKNSEQLAAAAGTVAYLEGKRSRTWRCVSTDGIDC